MNKILKNGQLFTLHNRVYRVCKHDTEDLIPTCGACLLNNPEFATRRDTVCGNICLTCIPSDHFPMLVKLPKNDQWLSDIISERERVLRHFEEKMLIRRIEQFVKPNTRGFYEYSFGDPVVTSCYVNDMPEDLLVYDIYYKPDKKEVILHGIEQWKGVPCVDGSDMIDVPVKDVFIGHLNYLIGAIR